MTLSLSLSFSLKTLLTQLKSKQISLGLSQILIVEIEKSMCPWPFLNPLLSGSSGENRLGKQLYESLSSLKLLQGFSGVS